MMAAILNSAIWIQPLPSWIQTPCYLLSDSLKNTLTPLWHWLRLIQSDSNLFILTQIEDGSHLQFCHLQFCHPGFSHLSVSSETHSHLPRLVTTISTTKIFHFTCLPTIGTKKNVTHWFWLNLMMAAILNSAILDSDTAILDSDTLLSSLRFTQKHSHSTLSRTNSIWLKLIHSHLNWWWQPSWILSSWIQPFCTKKLHSFILTELDDGSHLEFCHVWFIHCHLGFRHLRILSQIHSKTLSLYSDPASN